MSQKESKRLRTTITAEQLKILYEYYNSDNSPSRKIIEQIAQEVELKKRVVQVTLLFLKYMPQKSHILPIMGNKIVFLTGLVSEHASPPTQRAGPLWNGEQIRQPSVQRFAYVPALPQHNAAHSGRT